MDNVSDKWKSVKVPREIHDLLTEIKEKTDIPIAFYIKKAVKETWERDKKKLR